MRTDTNTQMNQILSDTDYKASIIKMIQQVITNFLKQHTKSQQINRNYYLKKQIEIIELKNTITEVNSVNGLNSRMEITKDRISELKVRSV